MTNSLMKQQQAQLVTMNASNKSFYNQPRRSPDSLRNKIIHADMRVQSIEDPRGDIDEQPLPILEFSKLILHRRDHPSVVISPAVFAAPQRLASNERKLNTRFRKIKRTLSSNRKHNS
jgi:hypothetical protein